MATPKKKTTKKASVKPETKKKVVDKVAPPTGGQAPMPPGAPGQPTPQQNPANKNLEARQAKCMKIASEVLKALRDADIRMVDEDYVLRVVLQKLEQVHTESFDNKIFRKIRKVIQSEFGNYRGKMYLELDDLEEDIIEANDKTAGRDKVCLPLSVDVLRTMLETPVHVEDLDFVNEIAKNAARNIFIGLIKLDIDMVWKMVKDSLAKHEERALAIKFGKEFMELTTGEIDKILKAEEKKQAKKKK